jgi:predicted acylesterase/phospholipase RssA
VRAAQIEADSTGKYPVLLIGAVDVLSGRFRTFNRRRDRITAATVLASAAIPNLFRAVRLEDGTYWDGLFSQNPPVRELFEAEPDELWVIQINPQQRCPRGPDPQTAGAGAVTWTLRTRASTAEPTRPARPRPSSGAARSPVCGSDRCRRAGSRQPVSSGPNGAALRFSSAGMSWTAGGILRP